MFEYYGWIRVESTSGRTVWRDDGLHEPDEHTLYKQLEDKVAELREMSRQSVDLRQTVNGLTSLKVAGLRNHRDQSVIDLFKWVAEHGKRSQGVLFFRDIEDTDRPYDYETQFRVFRLALGEFREMDELFEMPANPPQPRGEEEFDKLTS